MDWQRILIDRLIAARHECGGWGYHPQGSPCAETTALACMALSDHDLHDDARLAGLRWLRRIQRKDGSVPSTTDRNAPGWPTGLAILAWAADPNSIGPTAEGSIRRARHFLLEQRGRALKPNPDIYGHDVTLQGWPWVGGTHSWIEPTAYAILALRALGDSDHARVREGVKLILDRMIPTGGCNYGNKVILGNTLRPFPATTGVALAALAGEPRCERIDRAIAYLRNTLPTVRSPMTVAWGLIGLRAWDAAPPESEAWLSRAAGRSSEGQPHVLYDTLLLTVTAEPCPIFARRMELTHA